MKKIIFFICLIIIPFNTYAFNFEFRMEKCLDLSLEKEFNLKLVKFSPAVSAKTSARRRNRR